jgi:hypothetical protein
MRLLTLTVATLGAITAFVAQSTSAEISAALRNEQIDIAYAEPRDPQFEPLYQGLKARKVLEELRAFLAPLQLPRKITIIVDQCDQPNKPYDPGGAVTICYEYVARLRDLAAAIPADGATAAGLTREDAVFGGFVQAALQRTASAVFDLLDTPIWGREQDAADKLAAFLMLQFGPKAARKLIDGATYFFIASDRTWTGVDFSDVDATQSQRYYNYICMAYGGDPVDFNDYDGSTQVRKATGDRSPELTLRRIGWCPREYRDALWAFRTLILPHVDRVLLNQVLARDWLQPFIE